MFNEASPSFVTLSQLNFIVRQAIDNSVPNSFWVQAELASIHENHGHCYMELIEKVDEILVAQARACCWKNTWLRVGPKFKCETGTPLHAGMKVLLSVRANFHEIFGFSWIVNDIDPTFTLGDMARRRQEILNTLREEGIIDLNKQLSISPFCQNIAVISSATAAGYGDFVNQLLNNDYGFQFHTRLFPAVMQGEQVESSIIDALNEIMSVNEAALLDRNYYRSLKVRGRGGQGGEAFDAVIIIRGGGSTTDLSGFDTLALAENVANFPLPVITGIGHDRDKSVLDVVACVSVKTPTAVAAFLIDNLVETLQRLEDATRRITDSVRTVREGERARFQGLEQRFAGIFALRKMREENQLAYLWSQLAALAQQQRQVEHSKVALLEQRVKAVDPINILRRGYSITLHNGVAVKDSATLSKGDSVTLMFATGVATATVEPNSSMAVDL